MITKKDEVYISMGVIIRKTKKVAIFLTVLTGLLFTCIFANAGTQTYASTSSKTIVHVTNGNIPASVIAGGQGGSEDGGVYFGNYKQSSLATGGFRVDPIKWRVLENDNTNGKLFLLSDKLLDCKLYDGNSSMTVTWETASIRGWLNGTGDDSFINNAFSQNEQGSVATTRVENKGDEEWNTPGGNDTYDKIFFLSLDESTNTTYGFTDNNDATTTREAKPTDYAIAQGAYVATSTLIGNGIWWLRSPGKNDNDIKYHVRWVGGNGTIVDINDALVPSTSIPIVAARPAFNLDTKSVLFVSNPVYGKGSGVTGGDVGPDALMAVGTNTSDEWKFTLLDDGSANSVGSDHAGFDIGRVTGNGNKSYTIDYSGAATGTNEYISAIIKDSNGDITYYGRLKEVGSSATGSVTVNLNGKMNAGDNLYLFNEQYNGGYMTDYASALKAPSGVTPTLYKRLLQNNTTLTPDMTFSFSFEQQSEWDGVQYVSAATPLSNKSVTITQNSERLTQDEYVGDLTDKILYQEKVDNVLSDFTPTVAGTYCYLVKENVPSPGLADVTYTASQFIMLVEVEDKGGGNYKATNVANILYKDSSGKTKDQYSTPPEIFSRKNELIFYNTYGTTGGTTPTGIITNIAPFIIIGGAGITGLVLYVVINARRKAKLDAG